MPAYLIVQATITDEPQYQKYRERGLVVYRQLRRQEGDRPLEVEVLRR